MSTTRRDDAEPDRGGAFYDNPDVFATYNEPRPDVSDPTVVMEEPALLNELGTVTGLRIVDLGCGDATLGRLLLEQGCRQYVGIDGSANMVNAARTTLQGTTGEVVHAVIEDFSADPGSYDVVVSRLALHYVQALDPVLDACHTALVPGGRIVFSVVHPIITSNDARSSTNELRADWIVDRYFERGPRPQQWLGGTVDWHHRTTEDYVTALHAAGFTVTGLRECDPQPDRFDNDDELTRRRRIPLFLLLAGTRS